MRSHGSKRAVPRRHMLLRPRMGRGRLPSAPLSLSARLHVALNSAQRASHSGDSQQQAPGYSCMHSCKAKGLARRCTLGSDSAMATETAPATPRTATPRRAAAHIQGTYEVGYFRRRSRALYSCSTQQRATGRLRYRNRSLGYWRCCLSLVYGFSWS